MLNTDSYFYMKILALLVKKLRLYNNPSMHILDSYTLYLIEIWIDGRKNKVTLWSSTVSNLDDNNKDVQDTTEITEDGLFKCKICGVKFDNASAYEGHIAAGHLTPSPWGLIKLSNLPLIDCSDYFSTDLWWKRKLGYNQADTQGPLPASKQPERP